LPRGNKKKFMKGWVKNALGEKLKEFKKKKGRRGGGGGNIVKKPRGF